jgi:iron complex outermembrane receptor protein
MTGIGAAQVRDWRYLYGQARMRWNRLFAQLFINTSDAGDTYLLRTGQPIVDESRMLVGQLQHGTLISERIDLIYGVDAQRTDPRTGGTINGRNEDIDEITEIGAYLHSRTALSDRLDLFAAIRADDHSELEDPVWSPRAALVFSPSPNHSLRFSYNRAFSTPSTNNLFLDITVQQLNPALPIQVRTVGVPPGGLRFDRDCGGTLCMRSYFTVDPSQPLPSDITGLWGPIVAVMAAQNVDLSAVPAPSAGVVGTRLAVLDPTVPGNFRPVSANDVLDVEQLKPTTNEVLEAGYRGVIGEKLLLAANIFYEKRTNFIGPLIAETPNVFVDSASLATYLAAVFEAGGDAAPVAQAKAQGIAQGLKTIPLGTVTPNSNLTNTPDIYLTYRNFGELDLYGADLAIDALLTDRWTLSGTYSWSSDDFFPQSEVGGLSDVALNAPKSRGSLGLRYRDDALTVQGRGRFAAGFPMNSGVYIGDVESHTLFDFNVSYRLPFADNTLVSLDIQNAFNDQKQQFVGAPAIGRLVFLQAQYTFGSTR